MKKYFLTGLVILLPLALTIAVVAFVFNFLTTPFVGLVQHIFDYFGLLGKNFFFLSSHQVQVLASKLIILILLFFLTVLLGMLGRWFFFHYLLKLWDYILHRIPLVSTIYKTCQDVIKTMFGSKNKSFKQVVLVPFPSNDTYSIGLVTNEQLATFKQPGREALTSVFVPTTPNPTSGFLMLYEEKDLVYLDMKVEDAFKYVISIGMITSPFTVLNKEAAQRLSETSDEK